MPPYFLGIELPRVLNNKEKVFNVHYISTFPLDNIESEGKKFRESYAHEILKENSLISQVTF